MRHRAWPEGRARRNRMTVGVPTAHGVACLHLTAACRFRCRAICKRLFQYLTDQTRVWDAAALRALEIGVRNYGSVKSILEKKLDGQPLCEPRAPGEAGIDHPNIRGSGYYH